MSTPILCPATPHRSNFVAAPSLSLIQFDSYQLYDACVGISVRAHLDQKLARRQILGCFVLFIIIVVNLLFALISPQIIHAIAFTPPLIIIVTIIHHRNKPPIARRYGILETI